MTKNKDGEEGVETPPLPEEDYFEVPPEKLKRKAQREYFQEEYRIVNIAKGWLWLEDKSGNGSRVPVGENYKDRKVGDVISI